MNSGLVPTSIVDKNGRQTTVHRKPQDGSVSTAKSFPAPVPAPAASPSREEQENAVADLFYPPRYVSFVKRKLESLSDESVDLVGKCAKKLNASRFKSDSSTLAHLVSDIDGGRVPEEIIPFLFRGIDNLSEEFRLPDLKMLYLHAMKNDVPASDNVLDAHLHVVNNYFQAVLDSDASIPFKYVDNKVLFGMVERNPDKADIIIRHRHKYMPEFDGPEAFESDLENIAELHTSVDDGWL